MDKTIVLDLMRTCIGKGYSVTASAAVVGNWITEGCLNPKNVSLDRINNGHHEVGALGFTGGTATSFLAWCGDHDRKWDDMTSQAEFALTYVVQTQYPFFMSMGLFRYFTEIQRYLNCYTTLDRFKQADLLETAAISFAVVWWSPTYKQIHGGLTWASRDSGKYELTFDQRLQQEIRDRTRYAHEAYEIYWEDIRMAQSPKQNVPPQNAIPYASGTIGSDGCGVALIMAIMGWTSLDKWKYVADWMKTHSEPDIGPYACASGGTWAQGIPAFLNAHGVSADKLTGVHSEAGLSGTTAKNELRKHLKKKKRGWCVAGGIKTGCPSNYWTEGGHFLGFKDYDEKNDLYYITDSADPNREGWHAWSEIEEWIKHCGRIYGAAKKTEEDGPMYKQAKKLDTTCHSGKNANYVLLFQEITSARGIKAPKKYGGDGKVLKLDREYGNNCVAVCKSLQEKLGFKLTGVVDESLWRDLLGGI